MTDRFNYEYRRGSLTAFVGFGSGGWWLVCHERGRVVFSAAGSTRHWGQRFWFGRMLVCARAREWCAHGVGFVDVRGWFGVPRTGVASTFPSASPERRQRWHDERAAVRRTQ